MDFSVMSEADVRAYYRRATNKLYALEVLSGLTGSEEEEVQEFLGVRVPGIRNDLTSDQSTLAREMYDAGAPDKHISAALGLATSTISAWRRRNGLYHYGRGRGSENELFADTPRMLRYKSGMTDHQMAQVENVKVTTIGKWRARRLLPANKGGVWDG